MFEASKRVSLVFEGIKVRIEVLRWIIGALSSEDTLGIVQYCCGPPIPS